MGLHDSSFIGILSGKCRITSRQQNTVPFQIEIGGPDHVSVSVKSALHSRITVDHHRIAVCVDIRLYSRMISVVIGLFDPCPSPCIDDQFSVGVIFLFSRYISRFIKGAQDLGCAFCLDRFTFFVIIPGRDLVAVFIIIMIDKRKAPLFIHRELVSLIEESFHHTLAVDPFGLITTVAAQVSSVILSAEISGKRYITRIVIYVSDPGISTVCRIKRITLRIKIRFLELMARSVKQPRDNSKSDAVLGKLSLIVYEGFTDNIAVLVIGAVDTGIPSCILDQASIFVIVTFCQLISFAVIGEADCAVAVRECNGVAVHIEVALKTQIAVAVILTGDDCKSACHNGIIIRVIEGHLYNVARLIQFTVNVCISFFAVDNGSVILIQPSFFHLFGRIRIYRIIAAHAVCKRDPVSIRSEITLRAYQAEIIVGVLYRGIAGN